uniref:Uncharacterized protein n=1 Tax=Ditylenchus dipsaci TaxID=166011 RepID=A0A915CLV8_9BILA
MIPDSSLMDMHVVAPFESELFEGCDCYLRFELMPLAFKFKPEKDTRRKSVMVDGMVMKDAAITIFEHACSMVAL